MDLRQRFVNAATSRPHVLLVPVPGQAALRWATEDVLDAYGWPRATSPAQADLLVECAAPGPELAARIEVGWQAMPGPRARVRVTAVDDVEAVLLAGRAALRDDPAQRRDAADRDTAPPEDDMAGIGDGGMDMAGMDMAGMDMELPGGLTMAGRLEDRDGLRLEGLHLRLGPLLPSWPAGVELAVTLSGDVITQATAVRLDQGPDDVADPVDALALLLAAAGWEDGARRARAEAGATPDLLRRARLLRWSLRGLPAPGGRDLVEHLDALAAGEPLPACSFDDLAAAVTGLELESVALVVAAYGPALSRERAHA